MEQYWSLTVALSPSLVPRLGGHCVPEASSIGVMTPARLRVSRFWRKNWQVSSCERLTSHPAAVQEGN